MEKPLLPSVMTDFDERSSNVRPKKQSKDKGYLIEMPISSSSPSVVGPGLSRVPAKVLSSLITGVMPVTSKLYSEA